MVFPSSETQVIEINKYIYTYWKETEGTQDQMKFSRNKGSTQDQMIIII